MISSLSNAERRNRNFAPVVILIVIVACADSEMPLGVASPSVSVTTQPALIEVVVAFKDTLLPTDRELIGSITPAAPNYEFRGFPALKVKIPDAAIIALRANPRVAFVDIGRPAYYAAEAVGYQFQSFPQGHGIQTVHNDVAFGDARYGADIGIAVIDGGVKCFVPPQPNESPDFPYCAGGADFTGENMPFHDADGHGTAVASIIFAQANNSIGIRGIAPMARVYSLRVFDSFGVSNCLWSASAIDYATYTLSSSVSILNMSYGSPALTWFDSAEYENDCSAEKIAVSNAVNAGRFLSSVAGNVNKTGDSVPYPARLPGVSAVGGLTCSTFSGASCSSSLTWWSGSAKGAMIPYAATAGNMYLLPPFQSQPYADNGTSYAAPVVSGIVALIQSRYNIPRTGQCMVQHLKNTATARPGWVSYRTGMGAVRADIAWSTNPNCGPPGPI